MSFQMRWVGQEEIDLVAETRVLCYGPGRSELPRAREIIRADPRASPGDYLIAFRDGRPVGTATSLSMTMCVRGAPLPCQGVAWVGAIRTERRKSAQKGSGVASAAMWETLRIARERGHILTALMPFRASFYEHFGYGTVERRCEWMVPLSLLPAGDTSGFRYMEKDDLPAIMDCQRRTAHRGQCDIERIPEFWQVTLAEAENGFIIVDRPDPSGPVLGWLYIQYQNVNGRLAVRVADSAHDSNDAFLRQLYFLGSLKDQYAIGILTLPADQPLNWLLRESQVPHRPVSHATAETKLYTRMQLRILDHIRFLGSLRLPAELSGSAVVSVKESEGHESRFRIDLGDGRAQASNTAASPDITMTDRIWAAIGTGDLPASMAREFGLISVEDPRAIAVLSAFSAGPAPFCRDYF